MDWHDLVLSLYITLGNTCCLWVGSGNPPASLLALELQASAVMLHGPAPVLLMMSLWQFSVPPLVGQSGKNPSFSCYLATVGQLCYITHQTGRSLGNPARGSVKCWQLSIYLSPNT